MSGAIGRSTAEDGHDRDADCKNVPVESPSSCALSKETQQKSSTTDSIDTLKLSWPPPPPLTKVTAHADSKEGGRCKGKVEQGGKLVRRELPVTRSFSSITTNSSGSRGGRGARPRRSSVDSSGGDLEVVMGRITAMQAKRAEFVRHRVQERDQHHQHRQAKASDESSGSPRGNEDERKQSPAASKASDSEGSLSAEGDDDDDDDTEESDEAVSLRVAKLEAICLAAPGTTTSPTARTASSAVKCVGKNTAGNDGKSVVVFKA